MSLLRWKKPSSAFMSTDSSSDNLFSSLQQDINTLFNSFWSDANPRNALSKQRNWSPSIDFEETAKKFMVYADLPGMDKKDVHISLKDNLLTIKGERTIEEKKEEDKTYYRERFYGSFERTFILPEAQVDKENISAKFENGVLVISLPKKAEALQESKRIEIQ